MPDINTQGFTGMDPDEMKDIPQQGTNQGGNLQDNPKRASEIGKMGSQAQPKEAKRRGGQNSHSSS